jgi:hypothetical protein
MSDEQVRLAREIDQVIDQAHAADELVEQARKLGAEHGQAGGS